MSSGDEYSHDAWSTRWGGARTNSDEQAFVEAVSGALYVPHAAPEIRMIAEVMAAMSIPESVYGAEVTSIADARARRRRRMSRKAFAAVAAAALGLGMTATAYAGGLPAPIQDVAHSVLNAPKPHSGNGHGPSHDTPVGPDVTGPAGVGLCTAYANASKNGNAAQKSIAFGNLANAAGGADKIPEFCAAVQRAHPTGASSAHAPNPVPSDATSTAAPGSSATSATGVHGSGSAGNGNTHAPNPARTGNNGKGKSSGSTTAPPPAGTQGPPKKSPAPTP